MAEQTGQKGYWFRFDKVNSTASLIFSHLMIFPSRTALAYLDEPVDYTAEEDIIRFLQIYYTIPVKGDSISRLP